MTVVVNSSVLATANVLTSNTDQLAIDYTAFAQEIVTALVNLTANVASIKADISAIKASANTSATELTTIATVGTGDGFRTISPYEQIGEALMYSLFVNQGQAVRDVTEANATPQEQTTSLAIVNQAIADLKANAVRWDIP